MIDFEKSCCFTGYRPDKFGFEFNKTEPLYVQMTSRLVSAISSKIVNGCTVFYTGMAKGFDIEAAEYVELIKRRNKEIKLIAVIPYKGQENGWDEFWKNRYTQLLSKCDEVIVINEDYEKWVFNKRNCYMVDRCRFVITYFDGKSGGTANTLKYALKNGREIINIFDTDPLRKEKERFKPYFRIIAPEK